MREHPYALRLFELATGRCVGEWAAPGRYAVDDLVFTPDSQTLIGGVGGLLRAFGLEREPLDLELGGGYTTAAFSPDGRLLATGGHDNIIRLWPVGVLHEA